MGALILTWPRFIRPGLEGAAERFPSAFGFTGGQKVIGPYFALRRPPIVFAFRGHCVLYCRSFINIAGRLCHQ